MKKEIISLCFSLFVLLSIPTFAQGPGEPYHPMTAPGAESIGAYNHILYWENPTGIIYNQVYFSSDSTLVVTLDTSVMIYNGYPVTTYSNVSLNVLGLLNSYKLYYWRVVEYASNGNFPGPIWYFRSRIDYVEMHWLNDDFSNGTGNWIITNDGGACVWEIRQVSEYTLPSTAFGNCLAVDTDDCNGTTGNARTTARILTAINTLFHTTTLVEWDNDWRAFDSNDAAYVEFSEDGGLSWQVAWSAVGYSVRNTHEITPLYSYSENVLVRFRTVQPGWDWWWAIDNVKITGVGPLSAPREPNLLKSFSDSLLTQVHLFWDSGICYASSLTGYELQRKEGLPTDTTDYITLVITDPNTFQYLDDSVLKNHDYTYRIRTLCGPSGVSIWGNEATAYVPDIISSVASKNEIPTEFSLKQNYPNPFNPSTVISYQLPVSSDVTLKVYDVLGNEIATLVDEYKPAGRCEVEFSIYSDEVRNLSSGVYLYQLKAGEFIQTRKLILLK